MDVFNEGFYGEEHMDIVESNKLTDLLGFLLYKNLCKLLINKDREPPCEIKLEIEGIKMVSINYSMRDTQHLITIVVPTLAFSFSTIYDSFCLRDPKIAEDLIVDTSLSCVNRLEQEHNVSRYDCKICVLNK